MGFCYKLMLMMNSIVFNIYRIEVDFKENKKYKTTYTFCKILL